MQIYCNPFVKSWPFNFAGTNWCLMAPVHNGCHRPRHLPHPLQPRSHKLLLRRLGPLQCALFGLSPDFPLVKYWFSHRHQDNRSARQVSQLQNVITQVCVRCRQLDLVVPLILSEWWWDIFWLCAGYVVKFGIAVNHICAFQRWVFLSGGRLWCATDGKLNTTNRRMLFGSDRTWLHFDADYCVHFIFQLDHHHFSSSNNDNWMLVNEGLWNDGHPRLDLFIFWSREGPSSRSVGDGRWNGRARLFNITSRRLLH